VSAYLFVREGPNTGDVHRLAEDRPVVVGRGADCGLRLADPFVSRAHFRIEHDEGEGGYVLIDLGSRNPTEVNGTPRKTRLLRHGDLISVGSTRMVYVPADASGLPAEDEGELARARTQDLSEEEAPEILGESAPIARLKEQIKVAAPLDVTVLVTGESGTGKELVAAALHHASPRRDRRLVTVNCAAIPKDLLESELFGHEKGAFTGAQGRRRGKFELADGGTVFLDEIGELSLEGQAKMLRFLEERRFTRVGGEEELEVDVRIVAATNRDLYAEARGGGFRLDLIYRLEVINLKLPSLRERPGDIGLLARHFLTRFRDKLGRPPLQISPAALAKLEGHPWPGNIRELRNAIERAAIFGGGVRVEPGDIELNEDSPLAAAVDPRQTAPAPAPTPPGGERTEAPTPERAGPALAEDGQVASIDEVVKRQIEEALAAAGGNKKKAAELLGISRSSLYNYLQRFDLK